MEIMMLTGFDSAAFHTSEDIRIMDGHALRLSGNTG